MKARQLEMAENSVTNQSAVARDIDFVSLIHRVHRDLKHTTRLSWARAQRALLQGQFNQMGAVLPGKTDEQCAFRSHRLSGYTTAQGHLFANLKTCLPPILPCVAGSRERNPRNEQEVRNETNPRRRGWFPQMPCSIWSMR